jgi:hypothetical protein
VLPTDDHGANAIKELVQKRGGSPIVASINEEAVALVIHCGAVAGKSKPRQTSVFPQVSPQSCKDVTFRQR